MTLAFQLVVFALIATSSILLISIPIMAGQVIKMLYFQVLWIGLVILVGILNSLIS